MESELSTLLGAHRAVAFTGMCKNAGKTTILNHVSRVFSGEPVALTSVGRDGESADVATGTEKPPVRVYRGALIATAEGLLPFSSASYTVLDLTDVRTPLGRVAVIRCDTDGFVQLAGPSMTEQLIELRGRLFDLGASRLLVDGAVSRRSIAVPALSDGVILSTGAAYHGDMERVVADTAYIAELMCLPPVEDGEACLAPAGAVTDAMAKRLLSQKPALLAARDPSRLLFSRDTYLRLLRAGWRLAVLARPELLFVTMNPTSPYGRGFDKNAFYDALCSALRVPVIDAKELS